MPAIPESTRSSIIVRLLDHAEKNWPQLAKVRARYHGSFAYITGVLRNGEQIPLFRLRYGGSARSFGFAIYSAARERYEDAILLTGSPVGTPQEALDTACTVHLAGLGHEPPTNLRCHPLKLSVNGSWPLMSLLPIGAITRSGQILSRPSRVRSAGNSTGAVALRSQTGLDGF
jgi:hypothetical protein